MTNHLTMPLFVILGSATLLGLALTVHAKPMDAEAAKKLPELKHVLLNVRENGRLTAQDRLVVEENLAGGDPVLVSLAACIIAESKGDETNLCAKAEEVLKKSEGMPQAFIRLMLVKKKTEGKSPAQRTAAIEPLLKEANPYLRVETAKELLKTDSHKGEGTLSTMLSDESGIVKGEAFRQLHKMGKAGNAVLVPMPDERYELLLSIIEKANDK